MSRPIHHGSLLSPAGDIQLSCGSEPQKLDLDKEGWTSTPRFVNCYKCRVSKAFKKASDPAKYASNAVQIKAAALKDTPLNRALDAIIEKVRRA